MADLVLVLLTVAIFGSIALVAGRGKSDDVGPRAAVGQGQEPERDRDGDVAGDRPQDQARDRATAGGAR